MESSTQPKELKPNQHLQRQKTVFVTTSVLIGVLLVVSVILVLSDKFRPAADVSPPTPRPEYKLDGGALHYQTDQRVPGQAAINSLVLNALSQDIVALFSLQGLNGRLDRLAELEGRVTVTKPNGALVGQAVWRSTENQANQRKVKFNDPGLKQAIRNTTSPFNFYVKPKYYLTVAATNIADPYLPISLEEAKAGDFNDNNRVDLADATIFAANFNTTGAGPEIDCRPASPNDANRSSLPCESKHGANGNGGGI